MNPKTLLITTMLGIATTAAFGAASLRAPQIGGTATVTTPTATNTARAGTMRTQTMKTSSVSTPAPITTTQSIATPVSTETTDARIALLKGIKGFNPGKIKDTTAAQQELNAIDSRIEELQSKLDRAENATDQTAKLTDVYTKDQVEAKIDEKISALGTSTSAKDTYSKDEVDNLLTALEKKLPKIDDRGNINMIDTNGTTVSSSIWQPTGEHSWGPLGENLYYFVSLPNNQQSVEKIINFVHGKCNNWDVSPHESFACGSTHITFVIDDPQFGAGYRFQVANHFKGWEESQGTPEIIHQNGQVIYRSGIETYEYNNLAALKTAVCGETTSDWCDVYSFTELGDDGLGMKYVAIMERRLREGLSDEEKPTIDDRGNINMIDPNGGLISWSPYQYIGTIQYPVVDLMRYENSSLPNSEQSMEKIRNWARGRCQKLTQSQNTQNVEPRQILDCGLQQATYENGTWNILVAVLYKGYAAYQEPTMGVGSNGVMYVKFLESIEYDTEEKFETAACNVRDADNCYVQSFAESGMGYFLGGTPAYQATVVYEYNH